MPTLENLLDDAQNRRGFRQSTRYAYRRALSNIGVVDNSLSKDELESLLLEIDNQSTRRSAIIAIRVVLGINFKIPKNVPRKYDLPSEDALRFALMTSRYEVRGLLMSFAGLRIGEACAVTAKQLTDDRLRVDRQVLEYHSGYHQGHAEKVCRIAPVKTTEDTIVVPWWLADMIRELQGTDVPSRVRSSFQYAGKKHGVVLSPHSLRHWYATNLIEKGANLKLVSNQLRHSDVATTLRIYAQTDTADIHRLLG